MCSLVKDLSLLKTSRPTRTSQVMGNKVCLVLTVVFLCTTILLLEAVVIKSLVFYYKMTWEEARLHCQTAHIDLIPLELLYAMKMQRPILFQRVWTGVVRQPEGARVWTEVSFKWVSCFKLLFVESNLKLLKFAFFYRTGGLSGDDLSRSIQWNGGATPLCAFISKSDKMWHSNDCSNEKPFYCLFGDRIRYFKMVHNWYNASDYCQNHSGQLFNMPHFNVLNMTRAGWIGAYEKNATWSWVDNDAVFTNWAPNEPRSQDCAFYNFSSKKFQRAFCSQRLSLLCQDDNLVVIKENKTWEEALDHCLALKHTYNLLSLDESSDYQYIRDRIYRATTTEVWLLLVGSVSSSSVTVD